MRECDKLEWQICTKRVSQIKKMIPAQWATQEREAIEQQPMIGDEYKRYEAGPVKYGWPRNVGVLITVVTQAEADRDIPRLLTLKKELGIPWVGISYEPAQELVDYTRLRREPNDFDRAMPGFPPARRFTSTP